mmetsp:Transcript_62643/g.148317  ORF Transcript_62643/g.148317 Transcript_62643/m.148317 type:complete len:208 (-) Transcript_62643:97-720(-)
MLILSADTSFCSASLFIASSLILSSVCLTFSSISRFARRNLTICSPKLLFSFSSVRIAATCCTRSSSFLCTRASASSRFRARSVMSRFTAITSERSAFPLSSSQASLSLRSAIAWSRASSVAFATLSLPIRSTFSASRSSMLRRNSRETESRSNLCSSRSVLVTTCWCRRRVATSMCESSLSILFTWRKMCCIWCSSFAILALALMS